MQETKTKIETSRKEKGQRHRLYSFFEMKTSFIFFRSINVSNPTFYNLLHETSGPELFNTLINKTFVIQKKKTKNINKNKERKKEIIYTVCTKW